jgi:GntR family transcriptional repressor for pyruvate dehydrogenase complex
MVLIDKQLGLDNVMQVREILEPAIAAIAALSADSADLNAMAAAIDSMDRSLDDVETFISADHDFHLALAKATKNQLIVYLIDSIVDSLTQQRRQLFLAGINSPIRGQAHHKRILNALRQRQPEQAREAILDHLQQIRSDTQFVSEKER